MIKMTGSEQIEWLHNNIKGREVNLIFNENYDPQHDDVYQTIDIEKEMRALVADYPDYDEYKHILLANCEKLKERRAYLKLISQLFI